MLCFFVFAETQDDANRKLLELNEMILKMREEANCIKDFVEMDLEGFQDLSVKDFQKKIKRPLGNLETYIEESERILGKGFVEVEEAVEG